MKTFYTRIVHFLLCTIIATCSVMFANAQTTLVTPVPTGLVYWSDTDPGVIVFGVRNNNSSPIVITDLSVYAETGHTGTYTLWYHPTAVTGAPTAITAANGWIQTNSGAITATSNAVIPAISGLSITIPSNTTYRFALQSPVHGPFYGTSGSTGTLVSSGGVDLYLQGNASSPTYTGPFPGPPTTTPRSFYGSLTFVPANACTSPVAGQAITYKPVVCAGSSTTLDLTANNIGTGQTYQWQRSATAGGTYTNVGSASSSPLFTTVPPATGWYQAQVACGSTTVTSVPVEVKVNNILPGGTYTIDNTMATAGSNFASFTDAITALGCGLTGPVTFNVKANQVFNEDIPVINFTGTSTNTITFQKDGSGANPKIIPVTPGTVASTTTLGSHGDGIVVINGGDYITFDGIDLETNASFTGAGMMEYGYYLQKASATNACKNVVIKNCTINLNKAAIYSFGIFVSNISGTTSVTVSSTGGRSENIKLFGNTILNAYGGIHVRGYAASTPYDLYDQNIEIGVGGGNMITGYGGGASTAYGIYAIYQNNIKVANNTIANATGQTTTLYGMLLSTGTNSNVDIFNNTVTIQGAGTTSTIYAIDNDMGGTGTSNTVNMYNNTITGCRYTSATSGTMYLLYQNASAYKANIYGNTITDNINSPTTTGALYCLYQSGAVVNEGKIYDNVITNNSKSTGTTGVMYCIYNLPASTANSDIYNNTISGNTNTGSVLYGLAQGAGATTNVYKNKIFNQTSGAAAGSAYGISVTGGTTNNVYNNVVSELYTPAASATTDAVRGINVNYTTASTNTNLYYNSIYLNASSSGTNFSATGVYHTTSTTATSASLTLKNNNVVNMSTANGSGKVSAYRRSSTTLTNYNGASNNNNLYAGTPSTTNVIFYDGTNFDQNLSAYKARVSPIDIASVSEMPPFINVASSPYDLHLMPGIATQLESGAIPVAGITDDIDGDTRNASTPDIGADEFAGTVADLTGPSILYPEVAVKSVCTDGKSITATISDASGTNVTAGLKPRLWYKKSTENNVLPASNTSASNGWKYVEASNSASPFLFTFDFSLLTSTVAPGDSVSYFIVAQDLVSTPNVGVNIATFNTPPASVALSASAFPASGAIKGFKILSLPAIVIKANTTEICYSGVITLNVDGVDVSGGEYQWQRALHNTNVWTDIAGANTIPYTTATVTDSTDYRLVVKCGGVPVTASPSNIIAVNVNKPQVTATIPGTRCGNGPVTLQATPSNGASIKWYTAPGGGTPVFSGNSYNTPSLSANTTYYASAVLGGGSENVPSPTVGTSSFHTATVGWGLRFTVNLPVTIISVKMYPSQSTSPGAATLQVKVTDLSDVVLYTGPIYNFTATATATEHTIPVNISLPPGDYKMQMNSTGINNLIRESSGVSFPYTAPSNALSVTAGANGSGTAQTTSSYYWFYSWVLGNDCESPRTPVLARIDDCPMPVTLLSFTGEKQGEINKLSWTTTTEVNNAGFELERSADGKNFSKIAFVTSQADGNSTQALNYVYFDERPLAGNGYYRLKQIDKDGKFTYSNIVLIKGSKVKEIMITSLYPNPAESEVNVIITSPVSERVMLVVTDMTGKVVNRINVQLSAGDNLSKLQVSQLASGTYFIKTICANGCESQVQKFVKQ